MFCKINKTQHFEVYTRPTLNKTKCQKKKKKKNKPVL